MRGGQENPVVLRAKGFKVAAASERKRQRAFQVRDCKGRDMRVQNVAALEMDVLPESQMETLV